MYVKTKTVAYLFIMEMLIVCFVFNIMRVVLNILGWNDSFAGVMSLVVLTASEDTTD